MEHELYMAQALALAREAGSAKAVNLVLMGRLSRSFDWFCISTSQNPIRI